MSTVLLVDAAAIYAANASKLGHLRTSTGKPTGGIFGFFRSVEAMQKEWEPDRTFVCLEGGGVAARREIDPLYKGDRGEREEWWVDWHGDVIAQWVLAHGDHLVKAVDGEADDAIACLALNAAAVGDFAVIMSPDHDMRGLLVSPNVCIQRSSNEAPYARANFIDEYGFEPEHYRTWQALVGCVSDGVPAIMSEKAARDLLEGYNWPAIQELTERLREKERFEQNVKLVCPVENARLLVEHGERDVDALRKIYETYEMNSLAKKLDEKEVTA